MTNCSILIQLGLEVIIMSETELQILITIIAGVFSIVSVVIQTNKSSKNKYITGERSEWRNKLKELCSELLDNNKNPKRTDAAIIADFRTRLNAYGYIKRNDISKDGHIWDLLEKIESNPSDSLKEKLVIYITFLMKHDWERSKSEVSIKIPKLISLCLYILSNALFIYFVFSTPVDIAIKQDYVNDLIIIISIFSLVYFFPSLLKFLYGFLEKKNEIRGIIFIYFLTCSFYVIYFHNEEVYQFGMLNFPILIQVISVLINGASDLYDCKHQIQYEKTINNFLNMSENSTKNITNGCVIKSNNKFETNLKKYSIKDVLLLPFKLLWSIIKLLWQILLSLFQFIANIFYALIKAINVAIEYLKNSFINKV